VRNKSLVCAFILLFSILMTACSSKTPIIEALEFDQVEADFLEVIDVDKIFTSLEELSKKPRVSGTESEEQAAAFLTDQLESFGYKVDVQPFNFERYVMPESFGMTVDGFEGSLYPATFQFSVAGNVTGEIVDAGYGLESDYSSMDVNGKIALVVADKTFFNELLLNASNAGAAAIVIYFPSGYPIENWTLGAHDDAFIPALALSFEDGTKLLNMMDGNKPVNATVTIEGSRIEMAESQNLIATKQPDSNVDVSDEIVMIGAHYDSVEKAPGASDNASGTAVVLELARALNEISTNKEIRFLFFGAEELGLIGSEHYVSTLSKEEIKRSVAMFNLDMVGSSDAGELSIQTVDGMDNVVTILASKAHKELTDDSVWTDFGSRSDHTPFHDAGIDAALFIYYPLEDWYHSPDDTIDKISKKRLLDVAKIVGKSALELTVPNNDKE
jgi:aminopeptidase YwaD